MRRSAPALIEDLPCHVPGISKFKDLSALTTAYEKMPSFLALKVIKTAIQAYHNEGPQLQLEL